MLLRKFCVTLVVLVCIVSFVSYIGREMIMSTSIYGDAQREIQKRYGANPADLSMPLFSAFNFSNGEFAGTAEFSLCDLRATCYKVHAKKVANVWSLLISVK